jgi:hypothetical protein
VVPRQLRIQPRVRRTGHAHDREVLHGIQAERRDGAALRPVRPARYRRAPDRLLHEDRLAVEEILPVHHGNRERIAESAYALQRAEIMVEAAVLLRQHDDVLDVLQAAVGRQGQRPLDGGREGREDGAGAAGLGHRAKEAAAAHARTIGA